MRDSVVIRCLRNLRYLKDQENSAGHSQPVVMH